MVGDVAIGKYLSVRRGPADTARRTLCWTVLGARGDALGFVCWFPRWRQYCFEPCLDTVFNEGCLVDLAAFLRRVNREHRMARAKPRTVDLGPKGGA